MAKDKKSWRYSAEKKLLQEWLEDGTVKQDDPPKQVYAMHEEIAEDYYAAPLRRQQEEAAAAFQPFWILVVGRGEADLNTRRIKQNRKIRIIINTNKCLMGLFRELCLDVLIHHSGEDKNKRGGGFLNYCQKDSGRIC
jgi:hypothetical protein